MEQEPNYLTAQEMKDIISTLEGLNAVGVSNTYIGEVNVYDTNGEPLGHISFRDLSYVFIPGAGLPEKDED